jgi:hypothetical protein
LDNFQKAVKCRKGFRPGDTKQRILRLCNKLLIEKEQNGLLYTHIILCFVSPALKSYLRFAAFGNYLDFSSKYVQPSYIRSCLTNDFPNEMALRPLTDGS